MSSPFPANGNTYVPAPQTWPTPPTIEELRRDGLVIMEAKDGDKHTGLVEFHKGGMVAFITVTLNPDGTIGDFVPRPINKYVRGGEMNPLVIYHGGECRDGFCAAWLMSKVFPDAELVPANYGEPPPDVVGRNVYIVDFSYKQGVMRGIINAAKSVVVLDHHRTAEQELSGIQEWAIAELGRKPAIVFDMTKSGARLVWDFFEGSFSKPRSWLVDYTEDRDLWRWALPESHAVNAALRSYPLDLGWWDKLHERKPMELAVEGTAILRAEKQIIDAHVRNAVERDFAGHRVLCVNATTLISEIAGELATNRSFGMTYFERADGKRVYSLRSRGETGVDVSKIAMGYGGGGHKNAAGFEVEGWV